MEVPGKDIQRFQRTILNHSRYDFTQYSHTSLRRRLNRILLELDMSIDEAIEKLENDPVFLKKVVRKITVHTTELFRDPAVWEKIKSDLLPDMKNRSSISIWHPGCSTGQEVYSMMMILDDLEMLDRTDIYGSDISPDVLDLARQGSYKYQFNKSYLENFDRVVLNGSGNVSRGQRKQWKKYFHIDEARDVIQMKEFLRNKPVFEVQDLVQDPNHFSVAFDLIVCRNVIIYFNTDLQNRVFKLFHQNLKHHGTLILGVHESIMGPWAKQFIRKDPFYFKAEE